MPRLYLIPLYLLVHAGATIAQGQPADFLAGRWRSDAQFQVNAGQPEPTYFWVGPINGEVASTGKVNFKAGNGCVVSGLLSPVPKNRTRLAGSLNLANCSKVILNRTYVVDAQYISGNLKLTASAEQVAKGKPTTHLKFTTTLSRT